MIKDVEKLEKEMLEQAEIRIKKFIKELDELSVGEDFTINNIELLMTKYNKESKDDLIGSVNDLVSKYDETKIIMEKKD